MGLSFVSRRALAVGAMVVAGALGLSACGGGESTTASPGNGASGSAPAAAGGVKLVKPGKLTTCTNLPYEPFQFKQGDKVVGFDVDIVDLAAKKLGLTQEIVDIDFAVIKSGAAMAAGKCDVAAAGMTITEERKANIDFSEPYFDATQALLAKKGLGVKTLEEIKAKNLRLGAQASTTGLDYVKKQGLDPKEFADSPKELLGLQSGQVDVIVQDLPVVLTWLKKPEIADKFELVASLDTGEQYGIGLKKGADPVLLKTINETIAQAKSDGTYDEIFVKWFGKKPGELG
ncbi:polar amino acid transport system substrate-binding protein [Streptosporangium becharense]|uniref:Polar amino acid transport system substrate-binding protein n=1 Tax=Streptosporangium becharense TaxID=1816182 RepID=A0A7W9ICM3_9ACTN|nr:ABC transporter substrate-binding protein [Streptosporangium becharense]MBB2912937.1 polar amino acid transport system substrate-binding protein [Streptosporangium becharense]MBB5818238.1 polar amino acid transport system substrate-binding protein [Streptosporangium becharense]